MMKDKELFTIYIDRLRNGETEQLNGVVNSNFLEITENELVFDENITFNGEAYLAGDTLCIKLSAHAKYKMPCSLCNEIGTKEVNLNQVYFTAKEEELKSGLFLFDQLLREAIIIEIPKFITCGDKDCRNRGDIEGFINKNKEPISSPFANIDLEKN